MNDNNTTAPNKDLEMEKNNRISQYLEIMPHDNCLTVRELNDLGFFTAPASTHRHGGYEGGLFDHCLQVTKELVNLTDKLDLNWQRTDSPYIVGMYHDLCKCDQYIYDANTGSYRYEEQSLLPGHGDKSLMILMQYLQLTKEEIACIRWHMGAFEKDPKMWNFYSRAISQFPNVLYAHTADMIASHVMNI